MSNSLQTIKNDLTIPQLKAIKDFLEMQNLLLDLKLQQLESEKQDFGNNQIAAGMAWLSSAGVVGKKEMLKDLIEQNKTTIKLITDRIIELI